MSEPLQPTESPAYSRMTGEVYDLIYSDKDYVVEAIIASRIIEDRCESGGKDILEAACGTGRYMECMADEYTVEGFDLSPEQVNEAKKRLPNARIKVADMTDFDMGKQYDAVLCLFSSIGYTHNKEELEKAIACMAGHTKPGGLVLVEPWLSPDKFEVGHVSSETKDNGKLFVSRMGVSSLEGSLSVLAMHHMVGTAEGVEHFIETHKLAMHTDRELEDAFTKAGLEVEIDPEGLTGRRLCIGKKPL